MRWWDERKRAAFYEAFERHAAQTVAAAERLVTALREPARAPELAREISAIEHRGDKITHETIARLQRSSLAPFDRAEMHRLMSSFDDVLDQLEAAADRFVLFELREAHGTVVELAEVVLESARALERATQLLPRLGEGEELLALCVEINRLENKGDALYRQGIKLAYASGADALTAVKWHDIYRHLEAAADACEDVANVLEGLVLRYA
jgi:predicted phosphate transport protein (TIGR00153 family)